MAIINRGSKGTLVGTVIAVDPLTETIHFCSPKNDGGALNVSSLSYNARPFDKELFSSLGEIVKQQIESNPDMDLQKVSLILPDQLFLLDTVSVPIIHRKAMQHSLSIAVESIYQNAEDLNLMTYAVQQSKQAMTFGLVGIRNEILNTANDTFDDAGAPIHGITYASNAMVNGAMELNSKLRNSTFLLLDIKKTYARFAFVIRGCTMGYYDLPFGYEMMYDAQLSSEDLLFDHRAAKALVQNSKDKARAKQLAMAGAENDEQSASEDVDLDDAASGRSGRKLPKFMQRPIPQSPEEYIYENFRIFLKWALELINSNRDIVSLAKLDTMYINMPDEYRFLFDVINKKHEGRGITYAPLLPEGSEVSFAENLELYGGFFMNRFNEANTF